MTHTPTQELALMQEEQVRIRERDHGTITELRARVAELEAALRECIRAIDSEVQASGDYTHPTIKAHARVADKARAALKVKP